MICEIKNNDLFVKISDIGAEIKSVVYRSKERSWQNDDGSWPATSPILFPVCGNTSVKIGGKDYNIPFHGFARDSVFLIEKITTDEVTFLLRNNDITFAVFPFEFEFRVTYKAEIDSILITNEIKNVGNSPMPFAIGRHDSFLLDRPIGEYKLCFDREEYLISQKHNDKGQLINRYSCFGQGKELFLPEDYLCDGQTIIFGGIKSEKATLKTVDDRLKYEYFFGSINNILLWRPNGAKMICIEPWSALPDMTDDEDEDFLNKTRLSTVDVGDTKRITFKITYY